MFLVAQPLLNSETIGAVLNFIPEPREEAEKDDAGRNIGGNIV